MAGVHLMMSRDDCDTTFLHLKVFPEYVDHVWEHWGPQSKEKIQKKYMYLYILT